MDISNLKDTHLIVGIVEIIKQQKGKQMAGKEPSKRNIRLTLEELQELVELVVNRKEK